MSDPMAIALRSGRAAVYGILTPWNDGMHDYLPARKAPRERQKEAVRVGVVCFQRTIREVVFRKDLRPHLVERMILRVSLFLRRRTMMQSAEREMRAEVARLIGTTL